MINNSIEQSGGNRVTNDHVIRKSIRVGNKYQDLKVRLLHITIYIHILLIICDLIIKEKLDLRKMLIKIFDCNTETPK